MVSESRIRKCWLWLLLSLETVIILFITGSCYKEKELIPGESLPYLKFDGIYLAIDIENPGFLLTVNKNYLPVNPRITTSFTQLIINDQEYYNGDYFDFSPFNHGDSLHINCTMMDGEHLEAYLHFTFLPVIMVFIEEDIPDEPRINCELIISDATGINDFSLVSYAGIEQRGRYAATLVKKSYAIELWNDFSGNTKKYLSLLGMRKDDDWILDGMYIDKARMRNKVSMEIWKDIVTDSGNPEIHGKIYSGSEYIELFVNMKYQGLYCLMERIDQKQLDVERFTGVISGLIYKAESWTNTTKFISIADTTNTGTWDGWEQKYPNPEEIISWKPLFDFTDFVINSSDTEFERGILDYMDFNNLLDYFIFINACQASDNIGTNMFYSRHSKDAPFIISPWDLDLSWGRNYWDTGFVNPDYWISNPYYARLFGNNVNLSRQQLAIRWNSLRNDILSANQLSQRFTGYYQMLSESGSLEREQSRWPESNLDVGSEIETIILWLQLRLEYLDERINSASR